MHSASRSSASRECIEIRVLGLPPDLVDTVDTHDFKEVELSSGEVVSVFDASDESSDYWVFHEGVMQASEAGDVAALHSLLGGSALTKLAERYAQSTVWPGHAEKLLAMRVQREACHSWRSGSMTAVCSLRITALFLLEETVIPTM